MLTNGHVQLSLSLLTGGDNSVEQKGRMGLCHAGLGGEEDHARIFSWPGIYS